MLKPDTYLPHAVSDQFASALDIAKWLEICGEKVIATIEIGETKRARTASGLYVYSNGWVCRTPQ